MFECTRADWGRLQGVARARAIRPHHRHGRATRAAANASRTARRRRYTRRADRANRRFAKAASVQESERAVADRGPRRGELRADGWRVMRAALKGMREQAPTP